MGINDTTQKSREPVDVRAIETTVTAAIAEAMANVVLSTKPSDNLSVSEFGEIRTAPPGNRADVEFIYDKQPLLFDDISANGGTATHNANGRHIVLAINGTGATAVAGMRQHYHVPYTPGSGQEIDITGTLDAAGIGGGTAYVFLRSTVTGTTIVQSLNQENWTAAKTGVNWDESQIFRMSFQSLKVGRIQFSLVRNGLPVKVAEITNDNIRDSGYWQYASLPPYWKIYNEEGNTWIEFGYGDELNGIGFGYTMTENAAVTAIAICETVKSQGGDRLFDIPGFPFSADNYVTPKTVSTALVPVLSIRVAATFNSLPNRALIIPESFGLQISNPIHYRILYRPTLTNASWTAVNATYSGVESDVSATAVSGGIVVDSDYLASSNNQRVFSRGLLGRVIMALGYTGTSDILTIAAIRTGSSDSSTYASTKWREIR